MPDEGMPGISFNGFVYVLSDGIPKKVWLYLPFNAGVAQW